MRIKHVNFARGFRGGERQTLNLMEGLARLGIEQSLVCRPGSELGWRAAQAGLMIVEVGHPLSCHLRAAPSDIIHVHEARGAYWAALEHLLRKTPYVITRRIPTPISGSKLTASVYRHAAALFGVSRDVSQRLAQQTARTVNTILSCTTIHQVQEHSVQAIRRKLGGGPIIGHVGVLNDIHKGQSILIDAFLRLVADFPDARLLLVGDGPDRKHLEQLAGNDPRIVFSGHQTDVGSWIAAMDVFAFPSREEGLGTSVLDAMALGVPVVASSIGGLPELIGADERGLLIEKPDPASLCNAISRLLGDATLRARLIVAAIEFAKKNNAAAMAGHYLRFYQAIFTQERNDFSWLDTGFENEW